MKLYLISQDENVGYDTYDSAVVVAQDVYHASLIAPGGSFGGNYGEWCSKPDKVSVKYLGEAAAGIPAGIVLASFNAG